MSVKLINCCGKAHATPFCSMCGTELKKSPISTLLVYLKTELAAHRKVISAIQSKYGDAGLGALVPSGHEAKFSFRGIRVGSGVDNATTRKARTAIVSIVSLVDWISAIGELLAAAGGEPNPTETDSAPPARSLDIPTG